MSKERICNLLTPMNLQFFADGEGDGVVDNANSDGAENTENESTNTQMTKTYEDALAEIAAAQAEVKKAKADRDAALKKSGELTKQLRAKMTETELAAEKAAQEQEERDQHLAELEAFQKKTLAKERYIAQYSVDDAIDLSLVASLAEKAAEAETKGDMEALSEINMQWLKAVRKQDRTKFLGERARVNVGDGEESSMTKDEIMHIEDRDKRRAEIAKHLNLFTQETP